MQFVATWVESDDLMLSEISQKGKDKGQLIRLICGIWNNMMRDWRVSSEDKSMDRGYWKKTEGRETEEDTKKRWQGGNIAVLFKVSALGLFGVWKWNMYVYPNHWTHPTEIMKSKLQWLNLKEMWCRKDSIMNIAFALHTADLAFIPAPYMVPWAVRRDLWIQSQKKCQR